MATNRVHSDGNSPNITPLVQTGLDKYCPICKVKAPSEQNYCKVDGAKLSSLRCPECQTPGDAEDNFCGYCGCSMKAEDRQLEMAATGNRLPETSTEISVDNVDAEAQMRAAMAARPKVIPAPVSPSKLSGMFK